MHALAELQDTASKLVYPILPGSGRCWTCQAVPFQRSASGYFCADVPTAMQLRAEVQDTESS